MNSSSIKKALAIAGGLLLADAYFLEKYFFEIKHLIIGSRDSAHRIKIVLLADLHLRHSLWPFFTKLARKINDINPDLIIIAGDVMDAAGSKKMAGRFFRLLNTGIPKVAIMGNHDYSSKVTVKDFDEVYDHTNCTLLINETIFFEIRGKRIALTGVDDFIHGHASFHQAVKGVKKEDNHFVIIHSPLQQEKVLRSLRKINRSRIEEDRLNIQYIFAGHNHGGQVRLFNYVPILPEYSGQYIDGWYNDKPPYLYVSRGFGTSRLPFRFMCRSEVTVFDFGAV